MKSSRGMQQEGKYSVLQHRAYTNLCTDTMISESGVFFVLIDSFGVVTGS